jgi:ATP-dependent Clp protease, protease subunit
MGTKNITFEDSDMNTNDTPFDFNALVSHSVETRLLENRVVFISEGINAAVAKKAIASLLALDYESPTKPITIYLNSPGGEVNSGFAIFDAIRFLRSEIRIVSAGLTASIATVIFVACKKEYRYSLPNSKFLIHQPLIPGQIYGQASDLEITAREILKTRQKINELLAVECKQPLEKVEADTARDYWMNSQEALDYGLVTKIVHNFSELS